MITFFSLEEWEETFTLTHHLSLAHGAHKVSFKILSDWYECPITLHCIYHLGSERCWQCLTHPTRVAKIVTIPLMWYFSLISGSKKTAKRAILRHFHKRAMLRHFLTAAHVVIPHHWQWILRSKYIHNWPTCKIFRESQEFIDLIQNFFF